MKVKIIGFKVGKSRPTANRSYDSTRVGTTSVDVLFRELGRQLWAALIKSDFVSIRRVDE